MNKKCQVDGCNSNFKAKGMCDAHYLMMSRYGRTERVRRRQGTGTKNSEGYIKINQKYQHRNIAEKALGKPLPAGAEVHHVDGDRSNNNPSNLVICQDKAYHLLLHLRQGAVERNKGVHWNKAVKKWTAQLRISGKKIHVGNFHDKEEAYDARMAALKIPVSRIYGCSQ